MTKEQEYRSPEWFRQQDAALIKLLQDNIPKKRQSLQDKTVLAAILAGEDELSGITKDAPFNMEIFDQYPDTIGGGICVRIEIQRQMRHVQSDHYDPAEMANAIDLEEKNLARYKSIAESGRTVGDTRKSMERIKLH